MVEAVLFDATETLIQIPMGVGWHYAQVAAGMGVFLDASKLNAAFRQVFREMPGRISNGVARADDDRGWWRELVFRVLAEMPDLGSLNREAYFDQVYARFEQPEVWALYSDVLPTLSALSGKFRLGVISNFDRRLYAILSGLKVAEYFEHIVVSSEAGADKPNPLIFQIALSRFQLPPEKVLYVGDHPEHDWEGAAKVGLQIFPLQRPQNSLTALTEQLLRNPPRRPGA